MDEDDDKQDATPDAETEKTKYEGKRRGGENRPPEPGGDEPPARQLDDDEDG